MSPATAADPRVRRLLPVLPPLDLELTDLRVFGPISGPNRLTELKIDNPTSLEGELSMEMASVIRLTVEDPNFDLFRNPLLNERLTLSLGTAIELRYIADWVMDYKRGIGGVRTAGTTTVITFWSLGAAALKSKTGAKTWPAAHLNLEGWANALAAEVASVVNLDVVVPRPGSTPPRETDTEVTSTETTAADGSSGSLGFSTETAEKITVKGKKATPAQLRLIDRVLRHCVSKRYIARAVWACVTANIGEAGYDEEAVNPSSGAKGLFQLMPAPGWQARLDYKDIEKNIDQFMGPGFASGGGAVKLARDNPNMTPGTIASKVEGSDQGGGFYDPFSGEARTMIELWSGATLGRWGTVTGPAGTSDPRDESTSSDARPTSWRRGTSTKNESSWTASGRTADGLGRGRFEVARRLVIARHQDLILAAPHMSFTIDDQLVAERPGIDISGNARLNQLQFKAVAAGWSAPPGAVVDLVDAGRAASKAWLVEAITFRAGDPVIGVKLKQPTTKIPTGNGSSRTTNSESIGEGIEAAIKWAEQRIGWKEVGFNAGPQIGPLITSQGGSIGQPYCGYFCRGALRAGGLEPPVNMAAVKWSYDTSAAKQSVFRGRTSPEHAKPGDLMITGGPSGHIGLVVRVNVTRRIVETIEGNTSLSGGGEGVSRKMRPFDSITAIAQVDWTKAKTTGTPATTTTSRLPDSAVTT